MYELLFRSRWYALAWALIMAVSAVMFTTTGAGAWFTGTGPRAHASEEAREGQYRSWAEDDKRRSTDDQGYDPSSPETLRDGEAQMRAGNDPAHQTVPFSNSDNDADETVDSQ